MISPLAGPKSRHLGVAPLLLGLMLAAGCSPFPTRPETRGAEAWIEPSSAAPGAHSDVVSVYAEPFLLWQQLDGDYYLTPRVQTHLKAEMAMAMASVVTGNRAFGESAARDLEWVVRARLQDDGGLQWDGPANDYFFEVHQHWFLLASELVRPYSPQASEFDARQLAVWRFLVEENPAHVDFYRANYARSGAFFAFRDVNRAGLFQTQAPFKGSYEIGAALWSLALHEVAGGPLAGVGAVYEGVLRQALASPQRQGFYDFGRGVWVRALRWNGAKWSGHEMNDWKYSLHMQEGALEALRLRRDPSLERAAARHLDYLLARVRGDGFIVGLPDVHGSERYELGLALSCLALGAQVYRDTDPRLAARCRAASDQVLARALNLFQPESSEDGAILLHAFCRRALLDAPI